MAYAYSVFKEKNVSNVSPDRILNLSPKVTGVLRNDTRQRFGYRAFENKKLHAIQEAGLWRLEFRQDNGQGGGSLPEQLKQHWTNFNQMMKFITSYFDARGIKVDEVIA